MPNFLGPYNSKAAPEDKKLEHLLPLGPLWGSLHCLSFCYSGLMSLILLLWSQGHDLSTIKGACGAAHLWVL